MGFLATLGRILGHRYSESDQERLASAWKLYEEGTDELPTVHAATPADPTRRPGSPASSYDAGQWRKKLKTVLERLPESRSEWADLMADVEPLGLDRAWVERSQREEFAMLVRRAVADARVTREEHERLELARTLIDLPDDEAERILHDVVAEAEAFFGKPIQLADRPEHEDWGLG